MRCRPQLSLHQPAPPLAGGDAGYGCCVDAKTCGEIGINGCGGEAAYRADVAFGELTVVLVFAPRGTPITHRVAFVCGARVPAQIQKAVIGRDVVVVATLHALRARTNKRLQNDTVDKNHGARSLFRQGRKMMPGLSERQFANATTEPCCAFYPVAHYDACGARERTDASSVGHFVKPLEPTNRFPLFSCHTAQYTARGR